MKMQLLVVGHGPMAKALLEYCLQREIATWTLEEIQVVENPNTEGMVAINFGNGGEFVKLIRFCEKHFVPLRQLRR